MRGLRTQETNKFKRFFSIVQDAAQKKNSVFFLDAGDGNDFETDNLEGENLMGWLIPEEKLSDFEKEWNKGDVSDDWSDFYCWAIWENAENPKISFTE
jgi:hypothetical protein